MIYFNKKNRLAFTMIELVFVIVVLGILAALAMPRVDRDLRQEAADHVLSVIRYTQHLAVNDDIHDFSDRQWQRRYWRIVFNNCGDPSKFYYMIGSDADNSGSNNAFFARGEGAIDPANSNEMFGNALLCNADGGAGISENIFITRKYGVTNVVSAGGCNGNGGRYIGFDHLGRPHYGFGLSPDPDSTSYMRQICTFTFTMSDNTTFDIDILPETGYAEIRDQNGS